MKKTRQTARELALLGISQLPNNPEKISSKEIQDLVIAAIRTLATEVKEDLQTASEELQKGADRLIASELRAPDIASARVMVNEAIQLTQTAINRVGVSLQIPETLQLCNQKDVRIYAIEIITSVNENKEEIDKLLNQAMVDWRLSRLPRIDRDILRIAVAEILYLGIPQQVGINEAIELAKEYSGEDGHKFINGVLRRFVDKQKANA
jgi:N utilization substance protein B